MTPKQKPTILRSVGTSVTGAHMTIQEEAGGKIVMYLDQLEQSEVQIKNRETGELSMAQPLELVQVMSLMSLAWLAGGTSSTPDAPRVLLIGIGGGSITRVLAATLPEKGFMHSLDLEPEVVQAAIDFFGMPVSERCTSEAADGAAYMRAHRRRCEADAAAAYDVLILDAFTSEGLAASTQTQSTLDDAAACVSPGGLLLVNLHTGPKNDPDDQDYYVARRVLRTLCTRFDAVYSINCATTQNLIAVCHRGDLLDAGAWESRIEAQLARPGVQQACVGFQLPPMMRRFDYVGGKSDPMPNEPGVGDLPTS